MYFLIRTPIFLDDKGIFFHLFSKYPYFFICFLNKKHHPRFADGVQTELYNFPLAHFSCKIFVEKGYGFNPFVEIE